jgi:hypothetical protein
MLTLGLISGSCHCQRHSKTIWGQGQAVFSLLPRQSAAAPLTRVAGVPSDLRRSPGARGIATPRSTSRLDDPDQIHLFKISGFLPLLAELEKAACPQKSRKDPFLRQSTSLLSRLRSLTHLSQPDRINRVPRSVFLSVSLQTAPIPKETNCEPTTS